MRLAVVLLAVAVAPQAFGQKLNAEMPTVPPRSTFPPVVTTTQNPDPSVVIADETNNIRTYLMMTEPEIDRFFDEVANVEAMIEENNAKFKMAENMPSGNENGEDLLKEMLKKIQKLVARSKKSGLSSAETGELRQELETAFAIWEAVSPRETTSTTAPTTTQSAAEKAVNNWLLDLFSKNGYSA